MPSRTIHRIVIHCSASPSGRVLQQGKPGAPGHLNAVQVINAWHAARGFKRSFEARQSYNPQLPSIGYHYVVDVDGQVWTGRAHDEVGAHAVGHNANSLGVCMVGGAEPTARYTRAQWDSLAELVALLSRQLRIAPMFAATPGVPGICGHRDLSPDKNGDGQVTQHEWLKTCPGFDVRHWLTNGMRVLPQHLYPGAFHV